MAERRQRGPSAAKRSAILDAAFEVFLERGFAATSMDDVARQAAVSKQTVYAHFRDKETLFREMVTAQVGREDDPQSPVAERMPETDDLESDLREYAREHLALVMRPELVRLRRTLIGEAERFPDLAREWYRNGPERSASLFASWFARLGERGLLDVPDPMLAAQVFNWLVLSIPLNKAMAVAGRSPFSGRELDAHADEGVRVFLAAYGA